MHIVPVVPTASIVVSYPPPRYALYRRTKEPTWLDALHTWRDKTQSKLTWIEELKRDENNKATHIVTPVLSCIMYDQPGEDIQAHLRCAASNPTEAIEGAKCAVRSRLGGKVLIDLYGRVEDSGMMRSHCRYRVVDISYTYRLDNWAGTKYLGKGATKSDARQEAARLLLEGATYCMFIRKPNGRH